MRLSSVFSRHMFVAKTMKVALLCRSDYYFSRFTWKNATACLVTWINRLQNQSIAQICHQKESGFAFNCSHVKCSLFICLAQRVPTAGPRDKFGRRTEFLWPASLLSVNCFVYVTVDILIRTSITSVCNNVYQGSATFP